MITQSLEKLILCGKAFPKTFVAGGSQKSNINIQNDRFIIITDIVYFCRLPLPFPTTYAECVDDTDPDTLNTVTTQLTILGERGFNRFLFRDNLTLVSKDEVGPAGSHKIDTYLIHTKSVSFSFSKGGLLNNQQINFAGFANPETIASLPIPSDYGKLGSNAIQVTTSSRVSSGSSGVYVNNYCRGSSTVGQNESNELAFPVDDLTNILPKNRHRSECYPIANIFYVEILGMPGNINI